MFLVIAPGDHRTLACGHRGTNRLQELRRLEIAGVGRRNLEQLVLVGILVVGLRPRLTAGVVRREERMAAIPDDSLALRGIGTGPQNRLHVGFEQWLARRHTQRQCRRQELVKLSGLDRSRRPCTSFRRRLSVDALLAASHREQQPEHERYRPPHVGKHYPHQVFARISALSRGSHAISGMKSPADSTSR
ncbi:Uncharacterised protein [Mycobacteroides abscessus subsp. abscessus]|nr:Uncharacterised protein [Mycobacteroides abscessus subsp. abscessus]SLC88255.1 Uncharacterised protein [Mycobacteroides abscessus subsp. massiliense]